MPFVVSRRSVLRATGAGTALAVPAVLASSLAASAATVPAAVSRAQIKASVVLVHGAWADGSSWNAVTERLQHRGLAVYAVPNPLRGVVADAAYVAAFLATVPGPIVLVGHSYGGFVTTGAALANTHVKALVYIDAYIPAAGDTVLTLTGQFPGSQVSPAILDFVPSAAGVVDTYIKRDLFPAVFAPDLPTSQDAVLSGTQRPLALTALSEPAGDPAWASIPSWALIGTADLVLPPAAQRFMTSRAHSHVTEVRASHLSLISHPHRVADVVLAAVDCTV